MKLIKTDYTVIRVGAEPQGMTVQWPLEPDYDTIRRLVEPVLAAALLERVRVWHTKQYLDMFVDDQGQLKRLPINDIATMIYRANALQHQQPTPVAAALPRIYGPAVLFHRPVWS
ncbi:MAG: hypothetical protein RJA36_1406 [Pseudomonadota bacterium]|jgi:hypothetical protein